MSARPLVIVGAGGFARETVEVVRAINDVQHRWDLLGFLDDAEALQGGAVDGVPVIGPISTASIPADASVVVCTGHPGNYFSRKRIVTRLGLDPQRYATLVHPAAVIGRTNQLGPGTVVLATTVATTSAVIGSHVVVMPGVVFTHDDRVEDYATFGANVKLAGGVVVEEGAYVGSGALVREYRRIGAWSLVGMGAIVTHDVPPGEVWAGVPARFFRGVDVPTDVLSAPTGGAAAERR